MTKLEQALASARNTFTNFPDEAFTLWLNDRVRENDWPPRGLEWEGFLFGKSINYWQTLQWQRHTLTLTPEELSSASYALAIQLIQAASGKSNQLSAYISNTAERFRSCLDYIQAHGTTPGVVLLLRNEDGISVIEGNHRIAALIAFQLLRPVDSPALSFEAWVATPPQ